jgi:hypothetical protein
MEKGGNQTEQPKPTGVSAETGNEKKRETTEIKS